MPATIGTLQESALHAALKAWYALPGDEIEVKVGGYWVDLVRRDLLIEIQTGNFSSIKRKLAQLLPEHSVRLVYPLAREKWIVRVAKDGSVISRRKSPKHGELVNMFDQFMRLAALARHPNFSFEVLWIHQEDLWLDDGRGSWRRNGVSVIDHRLVAVLQSEIFSTPDDYRQFLPSSLKAEFTTRDLSAALGMPRYRASRVAYSLREMGLIEAVGRQGRSVLYQQV